MQLEDALAGLHALVNHEVIPRAGAIEGLSLEPMRRLMALLGDPHTAYPVIHLTGTNGKGSTGRMIESLLTTMGLRVGTYSSPHLETINERIRVGAEPIADDDLGEALGSVLTVLDLGDGADGAGGVGPATWFETLTAAALLHFANEAVDVAVVEVGLLGRFDATNVVDSRVSVITNIGLDHTTGVGEWRAEIAREKAGIITPGSTLVLGESDPGLRSCFDAEEAATTLVRHDDFDVTGDLLAVGGRQVSVRTPLAEYDEVFLALHGAHQADNAALALTAAEAFLEVPLPPDVVEEAFGTVRMPGRLEIIRRSPTVLLDSAHNQPGAEVLARAVDDDFGQGGRRLLLIGLQTGRDPVSVCRALRVGSYHQVVTCTTPTARGVDADVLAAAVAAAGGTADPIVDVETALDHVMGQAEDDDLVVVAGSIPVVGRVRQLLAES